MGGELVNRVGLVGAPGSQIFAVGGYNRSLLISEQIDHKSHDFPHLEAAHQRLCVQRRLRKDAVDAYRLDPGDPPETNEALPDPPPYRPGTL